MAASTVALLVAGCSSNQAAPKPTVTSADITACHDFGNLIAHGSTTPLADRLRLVDEMTNAQNENLRRQANDLKAAIQANNGTADHAASLNIAHACYALGLLSKTGQPT
jgi:hypothetical protein